MASEPVIRIKDANLKEEDLIENNFCPECLGSLEQTDNELVCKSCGLVVKRVFKPETRIPFNETRSPTCPLATDDSLGSYMSSRDLFQVLAKDGERSGPSIPITQIKVLTERQKHPIIERMDKYGSQLMKKWLTSKISEDSNISIAFAQTLGKAINKIGLILALQNNGRPAKKMTEAAFLWVWNKMNLPEVTSLRYKLWPDQGGIPEIREVNKILSS